MDKGLGHRQKQVLNILQAAHRPLTVSEIAWRLSNPAGAANGQAEGAIAQVAVVSVQRIVKTLEQRNLLCTELPHAQDWAATPADLLCWLPGHRAPNSMEISDQTVEILIMTVLFHYGGQTNWSTVCLKVQALIDELYPQEVHGEPQYLAIQASIKQLHERGLVQVKGGEKTNLTGETLVILTADGQSEYQK